MIASYDFSCYELLIGTSNPGKVREIKLALDGLPLMLRSLDEYSDLSAPIECGESYAITRSLKRRTTHGRRACVFLLMIPVWKLIGWTARPAYIRHDLARDRMLIASNCCCKNWKEL